MNHITFRLWLKENFYFLISVILSVCLLEYSYYTVSVLCPRAGVENIINAMLFCMGNSGDGWMGILFPLFAVLPFSMVYVRDYKTSYLGSLLMRQEKKKYFREKIIKNFFGGGLALALPLLMFAFHLLFVLDAGTPLETDYGYTPASMLPGLAHKNVYGYVAVMIAAVFFCGAAYAVFAFGMSAWMKNGILTLFLPFAGTIVLAFVLQSTDMLASFDFLLLYNPNGSTLGSLLHLAVTDALLTVSGIILFLTGVKHNEEN